MHTLTHRGRWIHVEVHGSGEQGRNVSVRGQRDREIDTECRMAFPQRKGTIIIDVRMFSKVLEQIERLVGMQERSKLMLYRYTSFMCVCVLPRSISAQRKGNDRASDPYRARDCVNHDTALAQGSLTQCNSRHVAERYHQLCRYQSPFDGSLHQQANEQARHRHRQSQQKQQGTTVLPHDS